MLRARTVQAASQLLTFTHGKLFRARTIVPQLLELCRQQSTAPAPSTAASTAPAAVAPAGRAGLFGQRFEIGVMHAIKREAKGSRNAQWARFNGLIPGIVYGFDGKGSGEVKPVYVREADLRREISKRRQTFLNTLFDVHIDGKVERVLARDFQMHPFKPKIICVNWLRYRSGTYPGVKVDLPLKSFNDERCPAFREGGWLLELMPKLSVYANGDYIPDYVMMDLRGKRLGDKVMASELELGEGITLRERSQDFAVAKLIGSRRAAEEDAAAEGDAAAGKKDAGAAKPAAAAAPAAAKKE